MGIFVGSLRTLELFLDTAASLDKEEQLPLAPRSAESSHEESAGKMMLIHLMTHLSIPALTPE